MMETPKYTQCALKGVIVFRILKLDSVQKKRRKRSATAVRLLTGSLGRHLNLSLSSKRKLFQSFKAMMAAMMAVVVAKETSRMVCNVGSCTTEVVSWKNRNCVRVCERESECVCVCV